MNSIKQRNLIGFKAGVIEGRRRYISEAIKFRRKIVERRRKVTNLRKKRRLSLGI